MSLDVVDVDRQVVVEVAIAGEPGDSESDRMGRDRALMERPILVALV